jgi:hypothetical protein
MNGEMKWPWSTSRYYHRICLKKLKKQQQKKSQESWNVVSEMNPGPNKQKPGVLSALLHSSVSHFMVHKSDFLLINPKCA